MAVTRDTVVSNIKPLGDAIVRRFIAGSAIEAGEAVAMASDGKVDPANASSATLAYALGIALQAGGDGDSIDVVIHGAVKAFTATTIGALIYVSNTPGELGEAAGTTPVIFGVGIAADVVLVRP